MKHLEEGVWWGVEENVIKGLQKAKCLFSAGMVIRSSHFYSQSFLIPVKFCLSFRLRFVMLSCEKQGLWELIKENKKVK